MKAFSMSIGTFGLVVALAVVPAAAQQSRSSFELRPTLTQGQLEAFTADLGSLLRFRQVGDSTTLGSGRFEIGAQFANIPFDAVNGVWTTTHDLARRLSYPQVIARFGASDRVDVGALGGIDPGAKYGVAGFDTRIALLRQADGRPVSVLIRPSVATLIYPSQVLVGTVSVDLSVSRAFGPWSAYGGVAGSTSAAVERSSAVDLDPATTNRSLAFAGLSYCWRAVVVSAELEQGNRFNYAFRVAKRF